MLRTDLVEAINQGNIWAFVGSGASIDAGCADWGGLVQGIVTALDEHARQEILRDARYQKALSRKQYAKCFSRIEGAIGRENLMKQVTTCLGSVKIPGRVLKFLADWPFAGYITINYDGLLEIALREVGERGWLSIGNSLEETRQISGDVRGVVWHVHGAINLEKEKSTLVLTEEDYEGFYLDNSPMILQLRGLLAQHRVIFVGFGFEDYEVMRLLKMVGRLCSPARPAFAFLSGLSGGEHEAERLELLRKYNIDVIPYRVVNGSHDELVQFLDVYNAIVLRRSLRFGQPERQCPSYDPETTGLMIYNQLALRHPDKPSGEVLESLLKSRILAILKYRGPSSGGDLMSDLAERVRLIQGSERTAAAYTSIVTSVNKCLVDLKDAGFIDDEDKYTPSSIISLTTLGVQNLEEKVARSKRMSDQFAASINDRAREMFPDNAESCNRVANAAECFLTDCAKRRALGVAMVWNSPRIEFQQYHIVALLQSLREFLQQVSSVDEGRALVRLVVDVLSRPSISEKNYIGVILQAEFGINLLGYDPDTVKARSEGLSNTLFLIDSSTLIPLLARSSVGFVTARTLLRELGGAKSPVATTELLSTEVAEHARWAMEHIVSSKRPITAELLVLSTGRAGARPNAFLEGFLEEVNLGKISLSFEGYLDSIRGYASGRTVTDDSFASAIRKAGVACLELEQWEGFKKELWEERDRLQNQIAERRKGGNLPTYKHERQVKAEAEALIIVRNLRTKVFKFEGKEMAGAYFISHTRAIDDVAGAGLPITMRPEAVLQWLSTVTACPTEELGFLFDNLLWELSERGLAIVDRIRLQNVFSPLVMASRSKFEEEMETHRVLVANQFGEDPEKAFKEVGELEIPVVVESYYAQKASKLEQEIKQERKEKEVLKAQTALNAKEREEYQALKSRDKQRKLKAKSKKRAAASHLKGPRKKHKK